MYQGKKANDLWMSLLLPTSSWEVGSPLISLLCHLDIWVVVLKKSLTFAVIFENEQMVHEF